MGNFISLIKIKNNGQSLYFTDHTKPVNVHGDIYSPHPYEVVIRKGDNKNRHLLKGSELINRLSLGISEIEVCIVNSESPENVLIGTIHGTLFKSKEDDSEVELIDKN